MEENKKRLMETINRKFEEGGNPIVVVFEMPPEFGTMRYCVLVDGKDIERMRSFEINVKNFIEQGIQEAPFYRVEQYLP